MKMPIVGLTASLTHYKEGSFIGQRKLFLNSFYIDAIAAAGAIPLILPIVEDKDLQQKQLTQIDGLILTGGADLQPLLYGEEPHPALGETIAERDYYELSVLRSAFARGLPILGICRGLQIINVAFGGTLYQDIPLQYASKDLSHSQELTPDVTTHSIRLVANTHLHSIFNRDELLVNSLHHQAVKKLAPGFLVNAYANDALVEGIEREGEPFVLGVQWHPEQMLESMFPLFQTFVQRLTQG